MSEPGKPSAPYTNRGVGTLRKSVSDILGSACFDAYTATVQSDPLEIMHLLQDAVCAGLDVEADYQETGCLPFYGINKALVTDYGKRLMNVQFGGSNVTPLVQCTGMASPIVADTLRAGLVHRPSRIDSAIDYAGEGLFARHIRLTKSLSKRHGLAWRPVGDWGTKDAGRTIELGSRRSQVMLRVYEKGLEMAHKAGTEITDQARQHVRCEVEFKPANNTAREAARSITPPSVWGTTAWLGDFVKRGFDQDVERVMVSETRESDTERALRFMGKQYSRHLLWLLKECDGDLDRFGHEVAKLAGLGGDDAQH